MPQSPLPAPANRLPQVPVFQPLNPGSYMDRQPFNVLPYQKIPNLVESMAAGVKMAGELVKMPREAQQTATEAMLNAAIKEQVKSTEARIKAVMADKNLTADQKNEKIFQIRLQSGGGYSGGHPTWEPYAGALRSQQFEQGEESLRGARWEHRAIRDNQPPPAPVGDGSGKPQPKEDNSKIFGESEEAMLRPDIGTQVASAGYQLPAIGPLRSPAALQDANLFPQIAPLAGAYSDYV